MSEEVANIWLGGLIQWIVGFCDTTGIYPVDGPDGSVLWEIAIYVGVAFLAFWLVRSSIRIVRDFLGRDDY